MNATFTPNAMKEKKLILVLREPVAREFSLYEHLLRECMISMREVIRSRETPSRGWNVNRLCSQRHCHYLNCKKKAKYVKAKNLKAGLATFAEYFTNGTLVTRNSYYVEHIQLFLRYFDRSQIMILNFDRLLRETPFVMSRIAKFLQLSEGWSDSVTLPHDNAAKVSL